MRAHRSMSGGSTVTRYRAQLFDGGRGERGRVIGLGAGVPQHPELTVRKLIPPTPQPQPVEAQQTAVRQGATQ